MAAPWNTVRDAARAVLPANAWREGLARALHRTGETALVGVFTCPPGRYLAAQAAILPEDRGTLARDVFFDRMLPKIEREGFGADQAKKLRGIAYAPLEPAETEAHADLADAAVRTLLRPVGALGLLNVFLFDLRDEVVGWLSLCTRRPSLEALEAFGGDLTEVARIGSQTISAALDLASAFGASQLEKPRASLADLSKREREIVGLVAGGMSDLNIAERLGITENTVGVHLRSIYSKLQVHTRVELLLFAGATRPGAGATAPAHEQ